MQPFSEKHFRQQQEAGKIRGYKIQKKPNKAPRIPQAAKNRSEAKGWLEWNLMYWANEHAVTLETELMFHEEPLGSRRKFRFDYAFTSLKIAVEYEGLFSEKSGHTTIGGFTKDVEKYNLAQSLGWVVVRCTAKDYEKVLRELDKIYALKKSA